MYVWSKLPPLKVLALTKQQCNYYFSFTVASNKWAYIDLYFQPTTINDLVSISAYKTTCINCSMSDIVVSANTRLCDILGCMHVCAYLHKLIWNLLSLHADCVGVMQKKPNKSKTGKDTAQQVTIVTVPVTEVETSPTKGGMYM